MGILDGYQLRYCENSPPAELIAFADTTYVDTLETVSRNTADWPARSCGWGFCAVLFVFPGGP